jgi:hypothetical protein
MQLNARLQFEPLLAPPFVVSLNLPLQFEQLLAPPFVLSMNLRLQLEQLAEMLEQAPFKGICERAGVCRSAPTEAAGADTAALITVDNPPCSLLRFFHTHQIGAMRQS